MTHVFWFIPTHGDGRYLGTSEAGRATSHAYMRQIAQAVDDLGYEGVLLPTGASCEDAWVVASSMIPLTKRLKFLVAIRPGLMSPSLAARMAATFDRLSDGRLLINVVTGGDPVELAGDGLHVSHDERYEMTDEFLTIWRKELAGETVDFQGKHLDVRGGKVSAVRSVPTRAVFRMSCHIRFFYKFTNVPSAHRLNGSNASPSHSPNNCTGWPPLRASSSHSRAKFAASGKWCCAASQTLHRSP